MPYADKEDQKACSKKHYELNKQEYIDRSTKNNILRRERNKSFIEDYKKLNPCVDCGESNTIVLEFDHITGDKFKDISTMANQMYGLDKIKEEIDKCEVVCANCHRIRTYNRRGLV